MSKIVVKAFSLSIDGYGAGPHQDLEHPLGVGGLAVFDWFFPTRTFQAMHGSGDAGGTTGPDDDFATRSFENVGAWIMGRNMFGPIRGAWPDENWRGWWGESPPYHCDVFVLTHYARDPIAMQGGTTFYFVTGGIEEAARLARDAANGKDVRIGGGVGTIHQFLKAGLVDSMHLAISPFVLGSGEAFFEGIDLAQLGFVRTEHEATPNATHIVLTKSA